MGGDQGQIVPGNLSKRPLHFSAVIVFTIFTSFVVVSMSRESLFSNIKKFSYALKVPQLSLNNFFSPTPFVPILPRSARRNTFRTLFIVHGSEKGCDYIYNYLCKFWFYIRCQLLSAFPNVQILPRTNTLQTFKETFNDGDVVLIFWRHGNHSVTPPHLDEFLGWRDSQTLPESPGNEVRIGVFHVANENEREGWPWYNKPDFILRNYWIENVPQHVLYVPLGGQVSTECPSQKVETSLRYISNGVNVCQCGNVTLKAVESRKYLYSFVGSLRSSRKELIESLNASHELHEKGFVHVAGGFGGDGIVGDEKKDPKIKYLSVVMESQFVLCPCGNVMETHRIYEALNHGAIPIIQNCQKNRAHFFPFEDLVIDGGVKGMINFLESYIGQDRKIKLLKYRVDSWWKSYISDLARNVTKIVDEYVGNDKMTI